MRASDDEPESRRWLDDVCRLHKVNWVDVVIKDQGHIVVCVAAKIYILDTPRLGAMLFWELDSFRSVVGHGMAKAGDWIRNRFRRQWWPWLREQGVPAEHFLQGQCGLRGAAMTSYFEVHKNSISTWALLLLCRKWYASLQDIDTKRKVQGLFIAIMGFAPIPFTFEVACDAFATKYVDANVSEGNMIGPVAELREAVGACDLGCGWPYQAIQMSRAVCGLSMASGRIAAEAFRGLAKVVDLAVIAKHTTSGEIVTKLMQQPTFLPRP